jgi:hypothetical protein
LADAVLNLVVLRSADLERAARFYAALGLRLERERHGSGPEHLAAAAGGAVFEVYPRGDAGATSGARVGFQVPSVAAAVSAAVAAGGSVVAPPREGRWGLRAVVADPDGHSVELLEGSQ